MTPALEPTDADVADLLERAADVIEVRGHGKGNWGEREGGPVCVRGALATAAGGHPRFYVTDIPNLEFTFERVRRMRLADIDVEACRALHRYLGLRRDYYADEENVAAPLVQWNDADERTAYDVIDALRGTAKEIRNASRD